MPRSLSPLFTTGKDNWGTPDALYQRYADQYGFVIDAAADETNHKCDRWFGPGGEHEDALAVDWPYDGHIWLNPPYSTGLQAPFIRKAQAWATGTDFCCVCLVPARTDTRLFHDVIAPYGDMTFLRGRVRFISDQPLRRGTNNSAPFPSMIVVFGGEATKGRKP